MKDMVNAAIIGCGGIHHVHADVINQLDGVRLTAVCDNKPERAKTSAESNSCRYCTDYHELLDDPGIDTIHICTPHWLHGRMALDVLRAGKTVLVEKPMAATVTEAEEMIAEDGRQGGNRLCIVLQNRYNESTRSLREAVSDGRYGALRCMRGSVVWHRTNAYYSDDWHGKKSLECGGVMINQAIHTLDLVQWLCGGASEIKGSISTDAFEGIVEVEDSAHMLIRMKNGVTAVFYATVGYGVDAPVEIEAVFDKAVLLMQGNRLYRTDSCMELLYDSESRPIGERNYWGSGHLTQIADFYRCLTEGSPFFIDGRQGIETIKLVCGLYEASRTGKAVNCCIPSPAKSL